MRLVRLAGAAALVLSACADGGTVTEPMQPQFAKPQAGGGLSATVYAGGSVSYREAGPSNSDVGTCQAGGSWDNTARGYVTGAKHPNCAWVEGGSPIAVAIGGRMAGGTLRDAGWWFGYQSGKDSMWGSGSATVVDGNGTAWWFFFGQELMQGRGNFMNPGRIVVEACSNLGCQPAVLHW